MEGTVAPVTLPPYCCAALLQACDAALDGCPLSRTAHIVFQILFIPPPPNAQYRKKQPVKGVKMNFFFIESNTANAVIAPQPCVLL